MLKSYKENKSAAAEGEEKTEEDAPAESDDDGEGIKYKPFEWG